MIVAMVAVRMMEVAVNQIVNMVAMRNGGMPAIGAVNMLRSVFGGGKSRRAFVRVGRINGNRVFIHMVLVRMMKMAVVKVIDMPFVLDGGVPAAGGMHVRMVRVRCTGMVAHIFAFLFLSLRVLQHKHLISPPTSQEMFLQVTCI